MQREEIVGAWRLVRWEIEDDRGLREPFGPGATGLLLYTPDGWMAATIAAAERPVLSHAVPRGAPEAERARAFDSFFHYAGRYEILPGPRIRHQVVMALNPAFVGSEQLRAVALQGATLTLSADEELPGGARRHHRLIWRR